ncbi:MAG: GNAT family N-acetyltransferase [Candidatus Eisenbacteria bacterium]|nr:GNAT family N-acetyltransferase [Candidatus Eisenbacteria bacterium]
MSLVDPSFEYRPLADPDVESVEEERLREILTQCFAFPLARWKPWSDLVGKANLRTLWTEGRMVAGLAVLWMGQYFGGRRVPMGGIAAVGVPPEERATGAARALMIGVLEDLHAHGHPLSALYASTQHLYRSVGYEQAGNRAEHTMPLTGFWGKWDRSIRMEPVKPAPENFAAMARLQAERTNGNLDRCPGLWQRLLRSWEGEAVHAYRIGSEASPDGYIIFTQSPGTSGYDMRVRDWAALSPSAYRRMMSFLADHRSLAREITWHGAEVEPLLCLPEEQVYRSGRGERWLLRIVDLPNALEMRGYPPGLEAELHLDVDDEVIPANMGRWILRVVDSTGTVVSGGRGDLRATIRGMAPLFSGLLAPRQLRDLGWIEAGDEALRDATRIFAGPEPWMRDAF